MRRALFAALLVTVLAGCGVPRIPGITPYKPVIQQGNYLSPDVIAQVKPGMSREQVRFILGTPLLTDIFHAERHTTESHFRIDTTIEFTNCVPIIR